MRQISEGHLKSNRPKLYPLKTSKTLPITQPIKQKTPFPYMKKTFLVGLKTPISNYFIEDL